MDFLNSPLTSLWRQSFSHPVFNMLLFCICNRYVRNLRKCLSMLIFEQKKSTICRCCVLMHIFLQVVRQTCFAYKFLEAKALKALFFPFFMSRRPTKEILYFYATPTNMFSKEFYATYLHLFCPYFAR